MDFIPSRWRCWHGIFTSCGYGCCSRWIRTFAERRLERVLTTDPGMGVARHVDVGYDIAIQTAKEKGIHIPMIDKAGDK